MALKLLTRGLSRLSPFEGIIATSQATAFNKRLNENCCCCHSNTRHLHSFSSCQKPTTTTIPLHVIRQPHCLKAISSTQVKLESIFID